MLKNIKKRNEGFTIIEVLIVLAIAGLILLVVFLAVPALQRNSRNTQRKNDVAGYVGAVNEFVANNGGKLPAVAADLTTVAGLAKLGSVTAPTAFSTIAAANASTPALDTILIVTGAKCTTTQTVTAGSARQFAVRYSVEGGSADVAQCQDS